MSSSAPTPARPAVRRVGAVGHRQDDARRAARAGDARICAVAVVHVAAARAGRAATASTIISSAAHGSRTMIAARRVPRVGGRVRQLLRHVRGRHRARAGRRAGPGAGDRRPGRAAGARQRHRVASAIFVLPPSFEVLEQRLRGRSKDSEAGDSAAARRRRAHEVARSPTTTTSSSTTSSTARRAACGRSCWPSARACRRCAARPKTSSRRSSQERYQSDESMTDRRTTGSSSWSSPARARASCLTACTPQRAGSEKLVKLAQKEVRAGRSRSDRAAGNRCDARSPKQS